MQAASRWGHHRIVQLLLDRGANIDIRSARLGTALEAATHWRQGEVAKLLLDRGAADVQSEKSKLAATDWEDKNIMPTLTREW